MSEEEGGQITSREGQVRKVEGEIDNRRLFKKLKHVESLLEEVQEDIDVLKGSGKGGRPTDKLELVEQDGADWKYTDVGARLLKEVKERKEVRTSRVTEILKEEGFNRSRPTVLDKMRQLAGHSDVIAVEKRRKEGFNTLCLVLDR